MPRGSTIAAIRLRSTVKNPRPSRTPIVMLVQPDHDDRTMYTAYLRGKQLIVICPKDGTSALALADKADVVVTALRLPGPMSGFELIQQLRHNKSTCAIPIIVLTACAWDEDRAHAADAGCNVFLSKPCLPYTLLGEVRHAILLGRLPKAEPARAAGRNRRGKGVDRR
jgi:two-component system cell cycle response regulator DivK